MKTHAVISCGGKGTRLRPLLRKLGYPPTFPKVMVPIGPDRRPAVEYTVRLLAHHGVGSATFVTRYDSRAIQGLFGDGSRYGMRIGYFEESEGMGNGEAVALALSAGLAPAFDGLLVYYGDIVSDLDVTALCRTHARARAAATLGVARRYPVPVTEVSVTERGAVTGATPSPDLGSLGRPWPKKHAMLGFAMFDRSAARELERSGRKGMDLMADFVPSLVRPPRKVVPYFHTGLWRDIGTPERYLAITDAEVAAAFGFLERRVPGAGSGETFTKRPRVVPRRPAT